MDRENKSLYILIMEKCHPYLEEALDDIVEGHMPI
jgi:hypothetical protein